MYNLYTITSKIHELLLQVAQRHDLKIEIQSANYYSIINGDLGFYHVTQNYWNNDSINAIHSDQIRQILNALKGVLGKNPKYTLFVGLDDNWHATNSRNDIFASVPKTKSDALCAKWLDSLNPLIDTNPDQVLSEVVDVLNQLLD